VPLRLTTGFTGDEVSDDWPGRLLRVLHGGIVRNGRTPKVHGYGTRTSLGRFRTACEGFMVETVQMAYVYDDLTCLKCIEALNRAGRDSVYVDAS